jgi:tRNA A37 threonylcarbamoyladenosine synthetase subunit TsaC/SUA5/YrdC
MQTQILPLSPTSFTFTPPAKTIDITISPTYSRDLKHLAICKEELVQGNVVAVPTETVYGLAAIAAKEDAVRKVFEAKKR